MNYLEIVAPILIALVAAIFGFLAMRGKRDQKTPVDPRNEELRSRELSEHPQPFDSRTSKELAPKKRIIKGPAYVVDGDTIAVQRTQIRLFGVDAPELDHPYGQKAKWALVALCKGQTVTAEIKEIDSHGRTVAYCYLPDGRDLSAEMVKLGLAIDWPKFSGGTYTRLEPVGIRKKLWLADARQKGRMHVWDRYASKRDCGSAKD